MPDQALYGVLNSGPMNLPVGKPGLFQELWANRIKWLKKIGGVLLNHSSPASGKKSWKNLLAMEKKRRKKLLELELPPNDFNKLFGRTNQAVHRLGTCDHELGHFKVAA